jgi:uncharacterized membrane protein HdeD (DUF308 family)
MSSFRTPPHTAPAAPEEPSELWWVHLVVGGLWLVFALLVFQVDSRTVSAISILVGATCFGAALLELLAVPASRGWMRLGRIALAVAFGMVGILAFIHPGDSFEALATIFAFYLLFRGAFDVVVALVGRGRPLWWLTLVLGCVQILLAFWAAGDFGHKAFLLVVWVGASALAHGVLQIARAFELRPG